MAKIYNGGINLTTSYKLNNPSPIADYMVVGLIADLTNDNLPLIYQFDGMLVYVVENAKFYSRQSGVWVISSVSTAERDAWNYKQPKVFIESVTLLAASWAANSYTKSPINHVAANNTISIGAPTDRAQFIAFGNSKISCTGQGYQSLTFECTTQPTIDIQFYIQIINEPDAYGTSTGIVIL